MSVIDFNSPFHILKRFLETHDYELAHFWFFSRRMKEFTCMEDEIEFGSDLKNFLHKFRTLHSVYTYAYYHQRAVGNVNNCRLNRMIFRTAADYNRCEYCIHMLKYFLPSLLGSQTNTPNKRFIFTLMDKQNTAGGVGLKYAKLFREFCFACSSQGMPTYYYIEAKYDKDTPILRYCYIRGLAYHMSTLIDYGAVWDRKSCHKLGFRTTLVDNRLSVGWTWSYAAGCALMSVQSPSDLFHENWRGRHKYLTLASVVNFDLSSPFSLQHQCRVVIRTALGSQLQNTEALSQLKIPNKMLVYVKSCSLCLSPEVCDVSCEVCKILVQGKVGESRQEQRQSPPILSLTQL